MAPLWKIMNSFCASEDADREEMLGKSRRRSVSHKRQRFMLTARRDGHTYKDIGLYLNRDYTTILHGCFEEFERQRTDPMRAVFKSVRA